MRHNPLYSASEVTWVLRTQVTLYRTVASLLPCNIPVSLQPWASDPHTQCAVYHEPAVSHRLTEALPVQCGPLSQRLSPGETLPHCASVCLAILIFSLAWNGFSNRREITRAWSLVEEYLKRITFQRVVIHGMKYDAVQGGISLLRDKETESSFIYITVYYYRSILLLVIANLQLCLIDKLYIIIVIIHYIVFMYGKNIIYVMWLSKVSGNHWWT